MILFFQQKLEQLKSWFYKNAERPSAPYWLAVISFTESLFFPIPPDPFLIAMLMTKRYKWLRYSLIVIISSIVGGIVAYIIGALLFDSVGQWVVETYHLQEEFETIATLFETNNFWTIFIAAFTPIPFKLFTLSAGLFHINFVTFLIASTLGRGIRFLAIGYLMKLFGEKINKLVYTYFNRITLALAIVFTVYILLKIF